MKFHENISNGFQLTERTQVHDRNGYVQRAITPTVSKPELWFKCSACRLIVPYIYVKFGENISDGISYGADTNDRSADGRTLKISDGIT